MNEQWNMTDALIIRIIEQCRNGCNIAGFIACGDYLDHSLFSFEELNTGLSKLISNGIVVVKGEAFFLSEDLKVCLAEYKKPKKRISENEKFITILNSKAPLANKPAKDHQKIIDQAVFESELKAHLLK